MLPALVCVQERHSRQGGNINLESAYQFVLVLGKKAVVLASRSKAWPCVLWFQTPAEL